MLMREAFQISGGENFVNSDASKADSSFPAFYAQDFIQFGLKNNIAAAIRLGELLLSEHSSDSE